MDGLQNMEQKTKCNLQNMFVKMSNFVTVETVYWVCGLSTNENCWRQYIARADTASYLVSQSETVRARGVAYYFMFAVKYKTRQIQYSEYLPAVKYKCPEFKEISESKNRKCLLSAPASLLRHCWWDLGEVSLKTVGKGINSKLCENPSIKQAGTCISCDDHSVCNEYLSYAQHIPDIRLKNVWDKPEICPKDAW